jgi:hypothetical protein
VNKWRSLHNILCYDVEREVSCDMVDLGIWGCGIGNAVLVYQSYNPATKMITVIEGDLDARQVEQS